MILQQRKTVRIAYLFHEEDASIFVSLTKYLEWLRRENLIEELEETLPGMELEEQIRRRLSTSEVIILLLSSNFDRDKIFNSAEVVSLIKACYEKGTYIWPIITKSFQWKRSLYKEYKIFFGENRNIGQYSPQDEAYNLIAESIGDQVTQILAEKWMCDGNEYYHSMCLSEALTSYEQSLSLIPNFVPGLFGKGLTLRKLNRIEEANQSFELIVDLLSKKSTKSIESFNCKRKFTNIACYKGSALLELKRYAEAVRAFQEVYQRTDLATDEQKNVLAEAYCGEGDAYAGLAFQNDNFEKCYEQALNSYGRAIQLVPDSPKYVVDVAKVQIEQGIKLQLNRYLEEALNTCKQIIQISPDYAPAYVCRGDAYFHLGYSKEDVLLSYDKAIGINQYEAQAYGGKGLVLLALQRPQEALSAFNNALQIESHNANFLFGKGRSLARLGLYQEALDYYAQAYKQGLNTLELLYYRAETLVELGEAEFLTGRKAQGAIYYKEAEDVYRYYLRQYGPMPENVYFQRGRMFLSYENWDDAGTCYQKAIDFNPNKADGYLGMSKVFTELSRYNDGLTMLDIASSKAMGVIDSADIDIVYGNIYSRLAGEPSSKDYYDYQNKAREHFEKATTIRKSVIAYIGLGKTHEALHYYERAIDAFDEALKINSNLSVCYFLEGRCYQRLEKPTVAYNLYKKALSSGLDTISLRIAIGDALIEMRSYFEAKKIFEELVVNAGNEKASIYCKLGRVLHELQDDKKAIDAFAEARKLNYSIYLQPHNKRVLENIRDSFISKIGSNPTDASLYVCIGDILSMLGELDERVIVYYTKAIEFGENSAETYYNRGEAFRRLYKSHQLLKYGVNAVKDYREVLALDPKLSSLAQQGEKDVEYTTTQQNFIRRLIFKWRTR